MKIADIVNRIKQTQHPDTDNLVAGVSCKKVIVHKGPRGKKVVLIDCGVKKSIVRHLRRYSMVVQVPYDADYDVIDRNWTRMVS